MERVQGANHGQGAHPEHKRVCAGATHRSLGGDHKREGFNISIHNMAKCDVNFRKYKIIERKRERNLQEMRENEIRIKMYEDLIERLNNILLSVQ